MITATYDRRNHRLRVRGHAGSGRKGQDLVCAAVSALVLTAAGNIASLAAQGGALSQRLRLEDGDADISCVPKSRMAPLATVMLDTVALGLQLLETSYPDHLRLTVLGDP